jgi:hypothetical protein
MMKMVERKRRRRRKLSRNRGSRIEEACPARRGD